MLVLEGLVGLHRTLQLQLLQHYCSGHRLGLLCYEWFALEMNRDHSVIFETASKYCILDSSVDYDGYSISSKGFLPTEVDIRSDQIRSVAQSCLTFCDPMNRSTPGLPVHHQLPEFTETHVHRVRDAIQPSPPLSSPSPPAPNPSQHQSLFQ